MSDWFNNNNMLKILSLVLGIMLWLVVSMDDSNTYQDTSSLQAEYLFEERIVPIYDDDQYVLTMTSNKVNVTLSGERGLIKKIKDGLYDDIIQFSIDLEGLTVGSHEVEIVYNGFPEGVQVIIDPKIVQVNLEAKYSREFSVDVEELGTIVEGYQFSEPQINPSRVYITGTKNQIEQVAFVNAYINIDDVRSTIKQDIKLSAIDSKGNEVDVSINPRTVEVNIPVLSPFLKVPLAYTINKYPKNGYAIDSINLNSDEVTIYGDNDLIKSYETYSGFQLDLSNYSDNQQLIVDLYQDDRLLNVVPKSVTVEVQIVESIKKEFIQIPITIVGLNNKEKISLFDETVNITLEGSANVLENITKDDIKAYINISNLAIGEHDVLVNIETPLYTNVVGEDIYAKINILED